MSAKVNYTKSARQPIYKRGKTVTRIYKSGKNEGKEYTTKLLTEPHEDGDEILVEKGQEYWHWTFMRTGKQVSLTKPKYGRMKYGGLTEFEMFNEGIDELRDEERYEEGLERIEEVRGELQEKLDNMPEQLQESSVLNDYIDECDELETEFQELQYQKEADRECLQCSAEIYECDLDETENLCRQCYDTANEEE